MPLSSFLQFVVTRCHRLHHELEAHGGQAIARMASDSSKLSVEVHTSSHLAIIEAWENAQCLDVTVMERGSGKSLSLSAGPCRNTEEAQRRIDALCELVQSPPR
jgi:hypothetical protein